MQLQQQQVENHQEEVIKLDEIFRAIKKRWKIIAIITLSITLLSAIVSFFLIKPKYEVTTKVFVGKESSAEKGYDNNDVVMYQKLMKTYAEVIQTKDLVKEALEKGNLDLKAEDVLANVTVVPRADTQILEIKYKSTSQQEAVDVCKALTMELMDKSSQLIKNSDMQIIEEPQYPEKPVSPNKTLNILIAFILGIMIGLGVVFLMEYLDNTFKTGDDVERKLNIPVVGIIPNQHNEQK